MPRSQIELAQLPANWRAPVAPPELAQIGDEFVRERKHCLLLVPSAIVPAESNWLMNPGHPDYGRTIMHNLEPVSYDTRMVGRRWRHRRNR